MTLPSAKAVFVTGAHMDMVGRLNYAPLDGVSNPGKIEHLPGGISLNMASAAVQLGLQCSIIGPIGNDMAGAAVRKAICDRGIVDNMTMTGKTGTYTSILAPDGSLVIALADLDVYEQITVTSILDCLSEPLSKSDFLVLNTNVPEFVLTELVNSLGTDISPRIAAATISPMKAPRLRSILGSIDVLFTNRLEAIALLEVASGTNIADLGRILQSSGVKSGTISNGSAELYWWEGERNGVLAPSPLETIASVTGAGDALGGTILAGLAKGLDFETAVQSGMKAANLTLQEPSPVCLDLNWQKLG